MATNVEVKKNSGEHSMGMIRRFTKRVQGAGILPRTRAIRYRKRVKSRNVQRRQKLLKLARKEKYDELVKLGKISEVPQKTRSHRG